MILTANILLVAAVLNLIYLLYCKEKTLASYRNLYHDAQKDNNLLIETLRAVIKENSDEQTEKMKGDK